MNLFKSKINTFNLKNKTFQRLVFGFVFFLFIILLFSPFFVNPAHAAVSYEDEKCSWFNLPRCFVLLLFKFSGFLLTLSGTIFVWIINTDNIKLILSGTATANPVYEIWQFVRDLLNMAFIMVLLFSAFCTIFQIESYNYKKLLWKIVLMALLVNFSFPITRFIIDASNILMYSVIKSNLFSNFVTDSSFVNIADSNGALSGLFNSKQFETTATLLAAAVMILLLAITFLVIGILLLVRMIVLAILIIFSPIAFVGVILPGAQSYANKWWDNLLKYSFFGPIMLLGVVIAVKFMNEIGGSLKTNASSAAVTQSAEATFVGYVAYLSLPIVLLWVIIKMSLESSSVVGKMAGAMKFAGMSALTAGAWGLKKGIGATGVSGGVKQGWGNFKKTGKLFGHQTPYGGSDTKEAREERVAGLISGGSEGREAAKKTQERNKARKIRADWKEKGGKSIEERAAMVNDTTKKYSREEKLAAALDLAETSDIKDQTTYKNARELMKVKGKDKDGKETQVDDTYYVENLNEGVKKKHLDLIIKHQVEVENKSADTVVGDLQSSDYSKIDFKNLLQNESLKQAVGEKIGKKSDREKIQIATNISETNTEALHNAGIDIRRTPKTETTHEGGTGI